MCLIDQFCQTLRCNKMTGYHAVKELAFCFTSNVCCTQDLGSQNIYDAGVALDGLSCFITGDLARDLANDIVTLVSIIMASSSSSKCHVVLLQKNHLFIMFLIFFGLTPNRLLCHCSASADSCHISGTGEDLFFKFYI